MLVKGALSEDEEIRVAARRILTEILPSAPPAVVETLAKTMGRADDFTRSDLAELLSLIHPQDIRPGFAQDR